MFACLKMMLIMMTYSESDDTISKAAFRYANDSGGGRLFTQWLDTETIHTSNMVIIILWLQWAKVLQMKLRPPSFWSLFYSSIPLSNMSVLEDISWADILAIIMSVPFLRCRSSLFCGAPLAGWKRWFSIVYITLRLPTTITHPTLSLHRLYTIKYSMAWPGPPQRAAIAIYISVSYTHLTLPTIYSV